jgi:pyrroloquinoline-quinone synthase
MLVDTPYPVKNKRKIMKEKLTFKQDVDSIIGSKSLLKHPFYVAWTEGKLSKLQLRKYAEQYFHNVLAEPTYLSAVHFNTPHFHTETNSGDISVRQEVLENLISEEYGEKNHPGLWKTFALALGSSEKELANATALPGTENLVTTFRDICLNQPFYAGLAAMHAFESQVPEIAAVKIDGLAKFYGMNNPDSYEFFTVHQEADIHHSKAEWALIEKFADTPEKKAEVLAATTEACNALWKFLDGIYENYCADLNIEGKEAITVH